MSKKGSTGYIRTAVCKKCGREFVVAPYHRFKDNKKYYCKWSCYNHRHDEEEVIAYECYPNRPAERP